MIQIFKMQRIRKTIFILASLLTAVLCLIASCNSTNKESQPDPFPDVRLPIHPDAQFIKQGFQASTECKFISYQMAIKFPAIEVIKFYDERFICMNFKQYFEDGYGSRRWENFNYSSGRWEPTEGVPARFIATWIREKKDKRVVLDLFYKYDRKNSQWKEVLFVECKVCKFFEFK